MLLWAILLCLLCLSPQSTLSYQLSDPVLASAQSQHQEARTGWLDLPLDALPRFGVDESVIFHAKVPSGAANTTQYRINTDFDFKVSLAFDYRRLVVPWLAVYDSEQRRTLKRVRVIFTRDEFEVVRVDVEPIYGSKIMYLDPSHPSLRGFELQYVWRNAEAEDFEGGLVALLLSALVGVVLVVLEVMANLGPKTASNSVSAGGSDKQKKAKS